MPDERPRIPISRPLLDEQEVAAVRRVLLSGWVTQGPEVEAFEAEFAARVGARHACAVSSGTSALHLALLAAGVRPGDEVVTVSHSFIATANSVRYCGAVPVFVDVRPDTCNMDPTLVERVIGPRTRAILCVHQLGMPCELEAITAIGRRHALPVVEDAACALGSEIVWQGGWQAVGRPHADVACFSFHPRKAVTTGEGGMLTTDNSEWDRQFRILRHQGMSGERFPALGFNYRMTDIQAAVGRVQLGRLPAILERRRVLARRYAARLGQVAGLGLPREPDWARCNWQSYCVRLPDRVDQRATIAAMLAAGIATRPGVMCAHREPAYAREAWSCGSGADRCACAGGGCARLKQSERAQDHCLLLPLFEQLSDAEQDTVAAALEAACA